MDRQLIPVEILSPQWFYPAKFWSLYHYVHMGPKVALVKLCNSNMQCTSRFSATGGSCPHCSPLATPLPRPGTLHRITATCGAQNSTTDSQSCKYFHCFFYSVLGSHLVFLSVLRHCWLGDRKRIWPVKHWMLVCWW